METKNTDKTKPIIKTKDLNVIYNRGNSNELHVLKDINIEIYPGDFTIIFGPSGCGKSTLLFSISGLESPTKGEVVVDGIDLSKIKKHSREMTKFHQEKIGIIFQAFYLIPSLTVFKNVGLPQIFKGMDKNERRLKIEKLLEKFNIAPQADKLPFQLSGGQQQRVAIARALVNDPDILLADEPVGNLDSKSSEVVLEMLKNINEKEKRTIVLVTHDARHLRLANRIIYMKDGYITKVELREKEELKEEPKIIQPSNELKFIMETYSDLSPAQLSEMLTPFKAKQLVHNALIDLSDHQLKRMESIVENFLMHIYSVDYDNLLDAFDKPLEEGGVGLDKRTAEKIAQKMIKIMDEVKFLKKEEFDNDDYHTLDTSAEARHLRRYILNKYDILITNRDQLESLDASLEMRLTNVIDGERLSVILDKPLEEGGVGLDRRVVKKIVKEMELIMLLKYK